MSGLISELKRRRVIKVATTYVIVGWIVIQIADAIREPLNMENSTFVAILITLAVGFLITVIVAWKFDITKSGIKRTPGEAQDQIHDLSTGRKIDFLIIGLLALALVATLTKDYWFWRGNAASVAVLPFVSMSSNVDDEHFADGLSEELLNVLAKIQNLSVPGRTSSFYYKGAQRGSA